MFQEVHSYQYYGQMYLLGPSAWRFPTPLFPVGYHWGWVWFTSGVGVVYIWVGVVYIWDGCGLYLGWVWFISGVGVVYILLWAEYTTDPFLMYHKSHMLITRCGRAQENQEQLGSRKKMYNFCTYTFVGVQMLSSEFHSGSFNCCWHTGPNRSIHRFF